MSYTVFFCRLCMIEREHHWLDFGPGQDDGPGKGGADVVRVVLAACESCGNVVAIKKKKGGA